MLREEKQENSQVTTGALTDDKGREYSRKDRECTKNGRLGKCE